MPNGQIDLGGRMSTAEDGFQPSWSVKRLLWNGRIGAAESLWRLERMEYQLGVGRQEALRTSCTFEDNPTQAEVFYTSADDGLTRPWLAATIFSNPPYGKAREPWVTRCIGAGQDGSRVILLMPAATDTRVFQRAASTADAVVFVRGRVKFGSKRDNGRQHAASHPSALIGWNTDLAYCGSLGLRFGQRTAHAPGCDGDGPMFQSGYDGFVA